MLNNAPSCLMAARRMMAVTAFLTANAVLAQPLPADPIQRVVITATRQAMNVVDAPAAISVITRKDIEARGAVDVLDAMRGETGISLQGRTIAGRKSISVRGLEGKHTLVLVDGKRVSASDGVIGHSDYQLDWIALQDIERIEIVRGPMSVLYGAEALGGVIQIITRRPGTQWSGGVNAQLMVADGGRGGDGERLGVHGAGPLGEQLSLSLSAAHHHQAAIVSADDPLLGEIEGRRRSQLSLGLDWRPSAEHTVELDWRIGDELRDTVGRETRGARRYYDNVTTLSRNHLSLGWTADWAGPARVQTQLRAYGTRLRMDNQRGSGVAALAPEQLDDRIVEGQVSGEPFAGHQLVAGFEWRDERLHVTGLAGDKASARHEAVFVQDQFKPLASLSITAGVRVDRHELFGRETSPRLYAVWHPAKDWTVKGGVAHGFKAPTLKQISSSAAEELGPNTFFGNPDLRPESNDSVEIGIGRDTPTFGWQAMLFNNRVRDLIVSRFLGNVAGRNTYVFDNEDRATLRGLELSTRWEAGRGFGLGLNYQYLRATDGDGQRLEKRPRHSLGLRVDWHGGPWRLGAHLSHHADQVLASTSPALPFEAVPSITSIGLWSVYDLGRGLELSAGVDNLANRRLADSSRLFTYAESPRTWRVGLRARF